MRRLLAETYSKWTEDRAPRVAAALAYYSAFSLAPLLLITAGLAGLVFGEDEARARIVEQTTAILGRGSAAAVEHLMGDPSTASRAGLVSTITGFLALLIGAVGVLAQLKDALNAVWDVTPSGKSTWAGFFRQYLMNFALVIATGFLLLVSLVATATLGVITSTARGWIAGPAFLWIVVDGLAGLAMTAAMFALIFRVIPDADVRWRDAVSGAVFTAVLFTAGRLALGMYLGREGGDSVYDAAGSILALLLWVYYSAQLVLFGAEFTYVVARRRQARA